MPTDRPKFFQHVTVNSFLFWALDKHNRKHTKTYKCVVCCYGTAKPGALSLHKRKHTVEIPYKYDVCSYRTAWPGALSLHKRKHTAENRTNVLCVAFDHLILSGGGGVLALLENKYSDLENAENK